MPLILPFSIIVTTAISIALCLVIIALTFLNLDLIWPDLIGGCLTAAYHLLVVLLAWYRMHNNKKIEHRDGLSNNHGPIPPSISLDPKDHTFVPYPVLIITLGLITLSIWIIIFGITTDIVAKGSDSTLVSGPPSHFDNTGLVASVLVIGVETVTIALFVVCCMRGQKKTNDVERDKLEDSWFYPPTPVLGRSGTLKSLTRMYSKRSTRSGRVKRSRTFTTRDSPLPAPPIFLERPEQSITKQHISPWEMLTPRVPSTRAPTLSPVPEIGSEVVPQLTPVRRPRSVLPMATTHIPHP